MKTDAWEGLRQALVAQKEKRPTGANWKTKHEIAKKLDMSAEGALSFIRRNRSHFEMFNGLVATPSGLRLQTWWRPKQDTQTNPKPRKTQGNTI